MSSFDKYIFSLTKINKKLIQTNIPCIENHKKLWEELSCEIYGIRSKINTLNDHIADSISYYHNKRIKNKL